ncbi:MAG TPA: hypothetical protein VK939_06690 [Longimicrobiales bacterium]|nr:hypothetical protein [Longimicrobiales bacterium]
MRVRALAVPALLLLLAGCGYFNSLYNAKRRFADAERAAQRGDAAGARSGYNAALEKAAVSYRRYPTGRWADDALFLIGRARFAMGEFPAAEAALSRVIAQTPDADMRTAARAYLGAALVRLGRPDSAVAVLDAALTGSSAGSQQMRFTQLWRGRALLEVGRPEGWDDLLAVAADDHLLAVDAGLEVAARGLAANDSARGTAALARLAGLDAAAPRADSIVRLIGAAGTAWQAGYVRARLPDDAGRRWLVEHRTRLHFARAQLSALEGDTAAAIAAGRIAAGLSAGQASADARTTTARWMLARAAEPEDLADVRALLLPSFAFPRPLALVRQVRTLEELLARAEGGQAAALFAAGEYARDVLGAPRLARRFFTAHADVGPASVTAPKALLAALALTADGTERTALQARLADYPNNPYVRALEGSADPDAYAAAEQRLARAIGALRADAEAAAESRDLSVKRAITALDSLRLAAHNDSMRVSCGGLLDSLAVRGIRADSVRAACLRSDTALVVRFLTIDSLELRDTTATRDTLGRVPGDTTNRQ